MFSLESHSLTLHNGRRALREHPKPSTSSTCVSSEAGKTRVIPRNVVRSCTEIGSVVVFLTSLQFCIPTRFGDWKCVINLWFFVYLTFRTGTVMMRFCEMHWDFEPSVHDGCSMDVSFVYRAEFDLQGPSSARKACAESRNENMAIRLTSRKRPTTDSISLLSP